MSFIGGYFHRMSFIGGYFHRMSFIGGYFHHMSFIGCSTSPREVLEVPPYTYICKIDGHLDLLFLCMVEFI